MWRAATSPLRSQLFSAPAPGPAAACCLLGRSCSPAAALQQRSLAKTAGPPLAAAAADLAATMTVELQADGQASEVAAPIEDRKLRILCLHGYLQNGEVGPMVHPAASGTMARQNLGYNQIGSQRWGNTLALARVAKQKPALLLASGRILWHRLAGSVSLFSGPAASMYGAPAEVCQH